jgi:hypothetical protein
MVISYVGASSQTFGQADEQATDCGGGRPRAVAESSVTVGELLSGDDICHSTSVGLALSRRDARGRRTLPCSFPVALVVYYTLYTLPPLLLRPLPTCNPTFLDPTDFLLIRVGV